MKGEPNERVKGIREGVITTRIQLWIPPYEEEIWKQFKEKCRKERKSLNEMVRQMVIQEMVKTKKGLYEQLELIVGNERRTGFLVKKKE